MNPYGSIERYVSNIAMEYAMFDMRKATEEDMVARLRAAHCEPGPVVVEVESYIPDTIMLVMTGEFDAS